MNVCAVNLSAVLRGGWRAQVVATLTTRQKELLGLRAWFNYGRIGTAGRVSNATSGGVGSMIQQGDARANGGVGQLSRS
jgi:hypothetical protein